MIPRLLHYCWYGDGKKSAQILHCMASWRRLLPSWDVVEWNESNTPTDFPYAAEALKSGQWAMLSDYARLHALYEHGGVYLDTDVELIQPLEPFLKHECFLGFQDEREQDDWVNNAVIGAIPRNTFVAECLAFTLSYHAHFGHFARSPAVTTHVLRRRGLLNYGRQDLGCVALYPREVFYPFHWNAKYSPACIRDNTVAIHFWEGSWKAQ